MQDDEPAARETSPATGARKASRSVRRQQLIDATIEMLAQKGQARLKLQDVAEAAGLSYGLVNFHFQSKENLLAETLQFMAAEYHENWQRALADAPDDPAAQLDALIRADFDPRVFTPAKLMAWCTFWGEAPSRPAYQEQCATKDEGYVAAMQQVCGRLIQQHDLPLSALLTARILRLVIEGIWLDMITMVKPYDRAECLRTAFAAAAALFPLSFDGNGLIAKPTTLAARRKR